MAADTRSAVPAPVALLIAVIAISTAAILVRETHAPALAVAFWRTAGGAILFSPALVANRGRRWTVPEGSRWLLVASGLCLGLHFALWLGSLELTTVASSVTLVSMAPVFVGAFASVALGETVSSRAWMGIGSGTRPGPDEMTR